MSERHSGRESKIGWGATSESTHTHTPDADGKKMRRKEIDEWAPMGFSQHKPNANRKLCKGFEGELTVE